MHRLWKVVRRGEANGNRLGLVRLWLSLPVSHQKAHRKAVGQITVGVPDSVRAGFGQAAERDEVGGWDVDPRLLGKLVNCGLGKASPNLSGACWKAPGTRVSALSEQNVAIVSFENDHCARHKDKLGADDLAQLPEIGVNKGHSRRRIACWASNGFWAHGDGLEEAARATLCATVMPPNNRIQPEATGPGCGLVETPQTALES